MIRLRGVAVLLACLPLLGGLAPPSGQLGSRIWVGRYQEIEEYLRTAECVSMEVLGPKNTARCTLRPGGPVARMAWSAQPPGVYRGFRESYKAEIAAYELDKLLKVDMVPPSVERQLGGSDGAAQLWVEGIFGLEPGASPGGPNRAEWEDQLARMTMFDDLIGNRDRNRGNMLRDAAWNLILLDHSRAFGNATELPRRLTRIDPGLVGQDRRPDPRPARRRAAAVARCRRDQGHPRPPGEDEGRDRVAAEIGRDRFGGWESTRAIWPMIRKSALALRDRGADRRRRHGRSCTVPWTRVWAGPSRSSSSAASGRSAERAASASSTRHGPPPPSTIPTSSRSTTSGRTPAPTSSPWNTWPGLRRPLDPVGAGRSGRA